VVGFTRARSTCLVCSTSVRRGECSSLIQRTTLLYAPLNSVRLALVNKIIVVGAIAEIPGYSSGVWHSADIFGGRQRHPIAGEAARIQGEFDRRGVKLIALSCDSVEDHR
jgi:hypothetical protein